MEIRGMLVSVFVLSLLSGSAAASLGNFTVIVLPDTQKYAESYPAIFTNQTRWIVSQIEGRNIVFVTQEGDIVDTWDSEREWRNANESMSVLDDKIPYGVLPGNHDMSPGREMPYLNRYFPVSRFDYPWYGGSYPTGQNDNSYQLFSAGGEGYVIIHLGFCPTPDVIEWADQVLKDHSDRRAIIVTHGYLDENAARNVHVSSGMEGGCTAPQFNTQYIWDDLMYPNQNVFLVLCGHVHAEARRVDDNIVGKPVHQILADYQGRENGGDGWLRVMKFAPSEDKIYVRTYSPYLDRYENDADSEFVLDYSSGQSDGTWIILLPVVVILLLSPLLLYWWMRNRAR
jgi:UDP-2,3-diacylglucosamine pyrophosphatase LpxH